MDDFDRRRQSQNVGSPFFDVAQQSLTGSWNSQKSHIVYRTPARNHAVSVQGVRSHSDVTSGHFYPELDFVDASANDSLETWSNPQSISLQNSVPPYLGEERSVSLSTPGSSNLIVTTNRIDQFVNDSDHPWFPPGVVPVANQSKAPYYTDPDINASAFRPGPGSDCYYLSDSGYYTVPAPSVTSRSYPGFSPDLPNLDPQIPSFDMTSVQGSHYEDASDDGPDSPDLGATATSRVTKPTRGGKKKCDICLKELKCPSDFKKHMLIHEKPHKCDVPGCPRTEGFGTVNDLDRHKASVHKILKNTRKFKCAAPGCKTAEKIWPRLDNFKQHLERMHKGVNVNDMIELSEAKAGSSSNIIGAMVIDNDLDGVGAGPGSSLSADAIIDSDDLGSHQQQASFSFTNVQSSQLSGQATKGSGRSQTTQRGNALHMLSDVAEMHSNIQSEQTQDPTRTVAIMRSLVNRSLSASDNLSKSDANVRILKQVQSALADGISQHTSTDSRGSSDEESHSSRSVLISCPHSGCNKKFKRRCELNKHEKRHTLPYVCTALGCNHRSGSKSDWQRHERTCGQQGRESFHDQSDTVRVCLEQDPSSATGKCGFMHTSQDRFEIHLKETHDIKDNATLKDRMLRYQPPDHGPGMGWCGFCVSLVQWGEFNAIGDRKNYQEGYGKYTDRADHIDHHVTKEGKNMEHYVCLEYHLKKEDATKDKLQRWFRAEHRAPGSDPRISDYVPKNPKKRRRGVDGYGSSDDEHKRKINEANWSCCQCGTTQLYKLYGRCSDIVCDHPRCQSCEDGKDHGSAKEVMTAHLGLPGRIDHRAPWDAQSKYGLMAS